MRTSNHILCLAAIIVITGCKQQQESVFNHQLILDEVKRIDSINRLIIANRADSVPVVINSETGEPYSEQEIRDAWAAASRDWKRFIHHVRTYKYQKASQYLLDADIRGGILGHLRESELRCMFILNVVKDMLQVYQPDNYLEGYLEWLYAEVKTESNINGIAYGKPQNVAPSFPNLVLDYGLNLSEAGYMDDALELLPIYQTANRYFYADDEVWVQLLQTFMESSIYHLVGDTVARDSIVSNFKESIAPLSGNSDKMLEYLSTLENHFKYMDKTK